MSALEIHGLGKSFGPVVALADIHLTVQEGEFVCLLGPTNAGKTTLLKSIAGLHEPDRGAITLDGADLWGIDPARRDVSLLFQNLALFPDRTAFENIAFPLRRGRMAEDDIRRRVHEVAELLRITHILSRRPATFSGGEQQRTAIGRAIAKPSRLLMLDEPLSNLDAGLRADLRREFRRLHRKLGQSILYVTHDQAEALSLADRIAVLDQGRIVQQGTADDLYDRPETAFVAEFIGTPPFNLLPATVDHATGRLVGDGFDLALPAAIDGAALPEQVQVAVRPEAFHISQTRQSRTPVATTLRWIERHGSRDLLGLEIGSGTVKVSVPVGQVTAPGQALWLGFDLLPDHLLDPVSQRFLRVSSEGTREHVQDL